MAIQIDEVTRDFQANKNKIPLLEMDELYTYIKKSKSNPGLQLIETGCVLLDLRLTTLASRL